MPLTADQAARLAPGLLAAVVVCAGVAVVVPLAPTGAARLKDFTPTENAANPAAASNITVNWPKADWPVLTENLDALNHLRSKNGASGDPENDPAEGEDPSNPRDPRDPMKGPEVIELGDFKYLGAIIAGDRVSGLIEVNNTQRFVRPGDVVGSHEIIECQREHLILTVDGEERKLALEPPSARTENAADRYLRERERALQQQRDRRRRTVPSPDESPGDPDARPGAP